MRALKEEAYLPVSKQIQRPATPAKKPKARTRVPSEATLNRRKRLMETKRSAIMEARKIGERSEKMSIAAINDRADITQVVTAVAEAELTLQTVVNVRDKVLEAYKDIIRMPV